ncbi:hypothetical protein [Haloferax sp. DFSO52]|uniref:hypothetical protein n=1 Tax=Haloferax sp. DFSO52 TaxID=3388505 RepID=UPI003A867C2C
MESTGLIRGTVVVLSVLGLLAGLGIGIWVHQDIQACHDQYDGDPTIVVECEDSLTDLVRGVSILSVVGGGIGLVSVLYRYYS